MSQNSERPGCWPTYLCLKKASAPCSSPASGGPAAPWSPRAGRSLPRRFPLSAPFWARRLASLCRAHRKKSSLRSKHRKKKPPRVPVVSGRGAGAGAGLRPMYATKKRAPQWLSYLPMSQKNERLWPPSPISGKKTQAWWEGSGPRKPSAALRSHRGWGCRHRLRAPRSVGPGRS